MNTKHSAMLFIFCFNMALTVVLCGHANKNTSNNKNNNQANSYNKNKEQSNQEIWEQDLTDTFKIEGSDQGIQKVNLKCGSNSMNVVLETEKPFTGVMYTRGSFYKQAPPCFNKPSGQNAHSLEINFEFDQCETLKDGELYSNIVVIQNDPELITPGDSAFSLECDFRQPKNLNVEANMQARDRVAIGSRITLTSPDPSVTDTTTKTVSSDTDNVVYDPLKFNRTNSQTQTILGTVEDVAFVRLKEEL